MSKPPRLLLFAAVLVVGLLASASPALAAQPPSGATYTIQTQTGQSIVPGTTDTGNHCDDCSTAVALPFPVQLYWETYDSASVGSNGVLQFASNSPVFANTCLPGQGLGAAIAPYWDDLRTDSAGAGVYTATIGEAPNRQFVIEWRNVGFFGRAGTASFEIVLTEGSANISAVYGASTDSGASATAGLQDPHSIADQFSCNSAQLVDGLRVDYLWHGGTPPPPPPPGPPPPPPPGPPPPPPGPPPPCDNVGDADPACVLNELEAGGGTRAGDTTSATGEAFEPPGTRSVWYRFTPAASGFVTANTCTGTSFDSVLAVYEGSGPNSWTLVAANDDSCGLQSSVGFATTAGTQYNISVHGFATSAGQFTLTFGEGAPPPPPPPPPGPPPPPPPPPPSGSYAIETETGQPILAGLVDIGNHCDDCTTTIELPFGFELYGEPYTSVDVSSNGILQFRSNSAPFFNSCLPANTLGFAIAAFWDDLRTDQGGAIYTATIGDPPGRRFVIEWRDVGFFGRAGTASFEAILTEGSSDISVIYGASSDSGASATAGLQSAGLADQFSCNSPQLVDGLRVNYVWQGVRPAPRPRPVGTPSRPKPTSH